MDVMQNMADVVNVRQMRDEEFLHEVEETPNEDDLEGADREALILQRKKAEQGRGKAEAGA